MTSWVPFTGLPSVDLRVRLLDDSWKALKVALEYAALSVFWSGVAWLVWHVGFDRGVLTGVVEAISHVIDDSLSITMTQTDFPMLALAIVSSMLMALMCFYIVMRLTMAIVSNAVASVIFLCRAYELHSRKTRR